MGFDKIFDIGAVIASWFTPEKRKERIRNEIDKLTKEREQILKGTATVKTATRLNIIVNRLAELQRMSKND